MTSVAFRAFFKVTVRVRAETGNGTVASIDTIVKRLAKTAGFLKKDVSAYLLRDGSTVSAQGSGDGLKRGGRIKHGFNSRAFIKR